MSEHARVLVVDDERSMVEFLQILLGKEGLDVATASDAPRAIEALEQASFGLVITDLRMPNGSGLDVLTRAKAIDPHCEVIVITAFGTDEIAFEALRQGAYDYLKKPFRNEEVRVVVKRALEKHRLSRENARLKHALLDRYDFSHLVGTSRSMQDVFDLLRKVAATRTNLLILGESGTGKELVARAVHFNSPRRSKPFVTVNCGAIPENLLESELFGHERGAFTGADRTKAGLFEEADAGTLFLDEVGELTPALQVKLLRVLQDRTFRRVGGLKDLSVDVRILAATNKDLEAEVAEGRFREDFFYRLNVIQVRLPPLRERHDDIALLADFFLRKHGQELDKPFRGITNEAMTQLRAYHYPGNVRELENLIERAATLEQTERITIQALPEWLQHGAEFGAPPPQLPDSGLDLDRYLAESERRILSEALSRTRGNKTEAARLLGITFRAFRYRLAKYGMDEDHDLEAEDAE